MLDRLHEMIEQRHCEIKVLQNDIDRYFNLIDKLEKCGNNDSDLLHKENGKKRTQKISGYSRR